MSVGVQCLYSRRFDYVEAVPRVASIKDIITVSGKLSWHFPVCIWRAASGDEVVLYVNGAEFSRQTTAGDGSFAFRVPASMLGLGRHVLWVVAPQFWRGCYAKSPEMVVDVVSEEEKKRIEEEERLSRALTVAAIASAAVAAVVAVLYVLHTKMR